MELLRGKFDHPAITTDVIVGFPAETEEEFEATRAFLEKIKFYEMHVFKYSKRKGTRAASMEHQVTEEVKAERSALLLAMEHADSKEYRKYYIGKEEEVLFEEEKEIEGKVFQVGHTRQYVKVAKQSGEALGNRRERGTITGFLTDEILLLDSEDRVLEIYV